MTTISITHEGGADAGPVTVRKKWSKDGSAPAGTESYHTLAAANDQHTFELEDGLAVDLLPGIAAPAKE